MSGGEKRRVALARILVAKPDLAIFDEPTNHLDADTITWLEEYLRAASSPARCCSSPTIATSSTRSRRASSISRTASVAEYTKRNDDVGAFEDFLEQKAERFAHAERVESNRQNFLRKEIEWLRRGPKARSTKQKARIQRAETAIGAEGCACAARSSSAGSRRARRGSAGPSSSSLDVSLDLGGRRLIDDLTLRLVKGDRVGIVGPNGAGKTTLLRLVTGELAPTVGQGRARRADEDRVLRSGAHDAARRLDGLRQRRRARGRGHAPAPASVTIGDRVLEMRAYLELFLFEGAALRRKVSALSGGERARVALALALKTGANVLLLDEPTNDLDIATLGSLAELIESWPGCVLVVSHDRFFLDRVVTSILAFEGDGKVQLYAGNWESYREQKREEEKAAKQVQKASLSARARSTG